MACLFLPTEEQMRVEPWSWARPTSEPRFSEMISALCSQNVVWLCLQSPFISLLLVFPVILAHHIEETSSERLSHLPKVHS